MARKSPRMEQRILYMLTNTLILFNWASCSAKIPEDVTVSQNSSDFTNVSSSQTPYSPHSYVDIAKECWSRYTLMMENVEHENLCEWQKVNRPYSYLRGCLEDLADALKIAFPNDIAHGYIMMSHSTYFGNCTLILQELIDPPEHVLLALIFAPISIIPFLVTLVVCKSKTSEPQA